MFGKMRWAKIDHRLDCERHAGFHGPDGLVPRIMRNVRCAMEEFVHAMTGIRPYNATAIGLCDWFYGLSDVPEECTRLAHLDGFVEAFTSDFYKFSVLIRYLSDWIGGIEIAMHSIVIEGHVKIHDVAFNQFSLIRDTVADDFVDGSANRFRKLSIIQGGGVRVPVESSLMNNCIDFIRRYTRFHVLGCEI